MSASTSDPESASATTGIAAKPRKNRAVVESDSDSETAAPAGDSFTSTRMVHLQELAVAMQQCQPAIS